MVQLSHQVEPPILNPVVKEEYLRWLLDQAIRDMPWTFIVVGYMFSTIPQTYQLFLVYPHIACGRWAFQLSVFYLVAVKVSVLLLILATVRWRGSSFVSDERVLYVLAFGVLRHARMSLAASPEGAAGFSGCLPQGVLVVRSPRYLGTRLLVQVANPRRSKCC